MAKIAVIGAGFSGISAACYLAQAKHEVHVYEKNATAGGRARQLKTNNGYVFDMGPSWYWMPDVFRNFFQHFNQNVEELYHLQLLNPSFDVVYPRNETLHIPAEYEQLRTMFETIEPGAGSQLDAFMQDARLKYEIGMQQLVHKPGLSLMEFMDVHVIRQALRLKVFSSFARHVRQYFRNPKLIALMGFPVLFLGATPQNTPALYSLINYAGLQLGTWYPQGGFGSVTEAMYRKSYCINDFIQDYHSCKGNAYGLANTLRQTANLKPKLRNRKLNNLFYAGQLTVPGPGVPPSLISGKLAATELIRQLNKAKHETTI